MIAVSPNGWTNNGLAFDWLDEVFDKHTEDIKSEEYRMLIMDGHGSHVTAEFILRAWELKILMCMPPHCSHLLQPLDVSVFFLLKHYHAKMVDDAARNYYGVFSKKDFLEEYGPVRHMTFTPSNILSGFKKSGLLSF